MTKMQGSPFRGTSSPPFCMLDSHTHTVLCLAGLLPISLLADKGHGGPSDGSILG